MSLFRGLFPEQRTKFNPEASFRVRGLKGVDLQQIPAVQDPFYAQDPVFWQCGLGIAGAAGNTSKLGVQTPVDPTLRCIVDGLWVSSATALFAIVTVVVGGAAVLVLTTDTNVFVKNRTAQEQSGAPSATGLLRIQDNGAVAGGGGQLAQLDCPAAVPVFIPLGYTLFGSEQLFVASTGLNQAMHGIIYGRLSRGGR